MKFRAIICCVLVSAVLSLSGCGSSEDAFSELNMHATRIHDDRFQVEFVSPKPLDTIPFATFTKSQGENGVNQIVIRVWKKEPGNTSGNASQTAIVDKMDDTRFRVSIPMQKSDYPAEFLHGKKLLTKITFPPPIRISEETTYVTEPRASDLGQIDYFLALERRIYPKEMKTDDNGYRLLVRQLGDHVHNKPDLIKQTYEKLGLNPDTAATLKFTKAEMRFVKHPTEPNTTLVYGPWGFSPPENIEAWLDANNAVLDLIAEATRKPFFCVPLVRTDKNATLAEMAVFLLNEENDTNSFFRDISHALRIRAYYRLTNNEGDKAIEDILAAYRLTRFVTQQSQWRDLTWGISIEKCLFKIPLDSLTAEQLKRLLGEIDAITPRIPESEARNRERYYTLETVMKAAFTEDWNLRSQLLHADFENPPCFDWNVVMEKINENYDMLIEIKHIPAWINEEDVASLDNISQRSKSFGDYIFLRLIGRDMAYPVESMECNTNMWRIAVALMLYEKENAKIPYENWQDAIQPYLDSGRQYQFQCIWHGPEEEKTSYGLIQYENESDNATTSRLPILIELKQPMPRNTVVEQADIYELCGEVHANVVNIAYRDGTIGTFTIADGEWEEWNGIKKDSEKNAEEDNMTP